AARLLAGADRGKHDGGDLPPARRSARRRTPESIPCTSGRADRRGAGASFFVHGARLDGTVHRCLRQLCRAAGRAPSAGGDPKIAHRASRRVMSRFYAITYPIRFEDTMAYGSHHFLTNFRFQCAVRESLFFDYLEKHYPGARIESGEYVM